MADYSLDEVDRQILHLLQQNARSISTESIGDEVGVAASTVRNRINNLEDVGVIAGYYPEIDYNEAGLPLHYLFFCNAPTDRKDQIVRSLLEDVAGVVRVNEFIDSDMDVLVEIVATEAGHLDDRKAVLEELGLEIKRGELYKDTHVQPFNHFGAPHEDME